MKIKDILQESQQGVAEGTRTGDPVYIQGCEWDDVVKWLVKNVGPITKKSPNFQQGYEGRGWILYPTNRSDEQGLPVLELSADTKLANKQALAKAIQSACYAAQNVAEGNYPDGSSIRLPSVDEYKKLFQQAVLAVKNAKTSQEYEAASERAGQIKDFLASKGVQVGPILDNQGVSESGQG